jgi:hypothetical protein
LTVYRQTFPKNRKVAHFIRAARLQPTNAELRRPFLKAAQSVGLLHALPALKKWLLWPSKAPTAELT